MQEKSHATSGSDVGRAVPRSPSFWLAAYMLSRCTRSDGRPPAALGVAKWRDAYELFYDTLGSDRSRVQFQRSLKGARDAFDGYHANARQGWKSVKQGEPAPLPSGALEVMQAWMHKPDAELESVVIKLLTEADVVESLAPPAFGLPDVQKVILKPGTVLKPAKPSESTLRAFGNQSIRRAANAKRIGDRAERLVEQLLRSELEPPEVASLRHHAVLGEKPGYDLSYTRAGEHVAVEVKGTTQSEMHSFELTAREVEAAKSFGRRYRIYLVSGVESASPRYQVVFGHGDSLKLAPVLFRAVLQAGGS